MAAVLGGIVAVSVLTLLLYGTILERRTKYAILKSIGAPHSYLSRLILVQSLSAVRGGVVFAVLAYAVGAPIAVHLVSVVVLSLPPAALLAVAVIALLMGCLGALLPLRRVGRIYPAELFRA
jgi:putative ABC transport system permease protein